MRKRTYLIPTLSALLFSSAVLSHTVQADEAGTVYYYDSTSEQSQTIKPSDIKLEDSETLPSDQKDAADSQTESTEGETADATDETAASLEQETQPDELTQEESLAESSPSQDVIAEPKEASTDWLTETNDASELTFTTASLDDSLTTQALSFSNQSQDLQLTDLLVGEKQPFVTVGNHELDYGFYELKRIQELLNMPLKDLLTTQRSTSLFDFFTIDTQETKAPDTMLTLFDLSGVEQLDRADLELMTELTTAISQTEEESFVTGKLNPTYVFLGDFEGLINSKEQWATNAFIQELTSIDLLTDKQVVLVDDWTQEMALVTIGDQELGLQDRDWTPEQPDSSTIQDSIADLIDFDFNDWLNDDTMSTPQVIKGTDRAAEPDSATDTRTETTTDSEADTTTETISDSEASTTVDGATDADGNLLSPVFLDGDPANLQTRETNLGNFLTDAMLAYSQTKFGHKSNFAVLDAGAINGSVMEGQPLDQDTLNTLLPDETNLVQVQVTGQEIYDLFTKSLGSPLKKNEDGSIYLDEEDYPLLEPYAGFLQVAGIHVQYYFDPESSNDDTYSVLSIDIFNPETGLFEGLNLADVYYLTTTEQLAAGAYDYGQLVVEEEGDSLQSVVSDYMSSAVYWTDYLYSDPYDRLIDLGMAGFGGSDFNQFLITPTIITDPNSSLIDLGVSDMAIRIPKTIFLDWGDLEPVDVDNQTSPSPLDPSPTPEVPEIQDETGSQAGDKTQADDVTDLPETLKEALEQARNEEGDSDANVAETLAANASAHAGEESVSTSSDAVAQAAMAAGSAAAARAGAGTAGSGSASPSNGAMISPRPAPAVKSYTNEAIVSVIGIVTVAIGAIIDHLRLRRPK